MFCTVVTLSASDLTSVRRLPYQSTNTRNLSLFWNVLEAVPIRDQDLGDNARTTARNWCLIQSQAEKFVTQAGRQETHRPTQAPTLTAYIAR